MENQLNVSSLEKRKNILLLVLCLIVGLVIGNLSPRLIGNISTQQGTVLQTEKSNNYLPVTTSSGVTTNKTSPTTQIIHPQITMVSSNILKYPVSGKNNDLGIFMVTFDVLAANGDVYVSASPFKNIAFTVERNGIPVSGTYLPSMRLIPMSSPVQTVNSNYLISNNTIKRFQFIVDVDLPAAGNAGEYQLKLNSIRWGSSDLAAFPVDAPYFFTDLFKTAKLKLD